MNKLGPVRYAGFWRRVAASLIDSLLLLIVTLPVFLWLYGPAYFAWARDAAGWFRVYGPYDIWLNYAFPFVVTVLLWIRLRGTPGKLLLGCEVVDAETGRALGIKQASIRYFSYLIALLPCGLGFLWVGWDRRKQGFHDKIAKTLVVRRELADVSIEELERELR